MSRDPRNLLEQAGSRQAPQPDAEFADALEARLRAVAVSMAPALRPAPPVPLAPARPKPVGSSWRHWWVRPLVAGLVVTALVLVAVSQGGLAPQQVAPPLELSAAVNVVVQLPDGTTVQNPEGMILPEGATVTVGDGGSARIGNLTVTAGEVVTVHGGRAQVERVHQATSGTALATPPHGPPSGAPTGTPSGTPSGLGASTGPTSTPGPSAPAESGSPAPSTPSGPTPSPAPSSTPGSTPGPTAAPTPKPVAIVAPKLRARRVAAHVIAVDWSRTAGAKSYVLIMTRSKTGIAPRPVYPGGRVLATFSKPPGAPVQFVLPPGVAQVKLLVVALDKDGNELARSLIVRVAVVLPAASPSPSP